METYQDAENQNYGWSFYNGLYYKLLAGSMVENTSPVWVISSDCGESVINFGFDADRYSLLEAMDLYKLHVGSNENNSSEA